MGSREVALLEFVLLVCAGNLCAATQNLFNSSSNETLNTIPQKLLTTGSKLLRSVLLTDTQTNGTKHDDLVRPASYRLRIYQLSRPKPLQPHEGQMQTSQTPPSAWAAKLTSDQLEQREPVQAQESRSLVPGPDLNPSVEKGSKVMVTFQQRVPVPAISVSVRCGEGEVSIQVDQNFLGNGQLVRPSDLTLGGCAALHITDQILLFQSELHGCRSNLTMTEEALIYSFSLIYSPTPIGNTFILKTNPAEAVIECHYWRRHQVSSGAAMPTWTLFASTKMAEQQLQFSLRLMTDDWTFQRPSNVYFLNDDMHIEASVHGGQHVPLRVYIDSCVATVNPDPNSQPRYPFINNHGCLSDAKLTGARSFFMQRIREDKLQFQLKAFRFHQPHSNLLYITCHLKATTTSSSIDWQHKACSFLTEANRWVASGGDNNVCSCCETSCSERRGRRAADIGVPLDLQWGATAALGPVLLEENILKEEQSELPLKLAPQHKKQEVIPTGSITPIALLCGTVAAVVALSVMGVAILGRQYKPVGYTVCT